MLHHNKIQHAQPCVSYRCRLERDISQEDKTILRIKPLTIRYLLDFIKDAREEDLQEVEEANYDIPFSEHTIEGLVNAKAGCIVDAKTDRVFAIGGVTPACVVWLLCTHAVEEQPVHFLRFMRKTLKETLEMYPTIFNTAWEGNPLHIKWLTWMGAEWLDTVNIGGFKTFRFRRETANV